MNSPSSPTSKPAELVQIDPERAGQRIDNFLLGRFKGVPRSRVYSMLRKGEVRVNKGRIKPHYQLQAGDIVRIPPVRETEPAEMVAGDQLLALLERSILFENDGFLAINKPAGLAVHGGSGLKFGVIEALRQLRPDARSLELVHRLDRDTSGCLLIAKKRSTLRQLHTLMRGEAGPMEKTYLTLVKGAWRGGERQVDAPLQKNILQSGERMVRVSADGKPSLSIFTPLTRYAEATLMAVTLVTGRTHQIRVHATSIGHPIAGDDKYGDADFNREMKFRGLKRLFLHAQRLAFVMSESGDSFEITAPLPAELEGVLGRLTQQ